MDEEKRSNPLLRVLAFLVTLVLVIGAVVLVANWERLNFDSLRRYITYRSLEKNENGQVGPFLYTGGIGSSFVLPGEDLMVCSSSGIWLYSESGTAYLDQPCTLANPIASVAGNTALVYDAGGSDLFLYRDRQLIYTHPVIEGKDILSASLNSQGLLTVVTQASGVKGEVTVYDASLRERMGIKISSRFVTDAVLSPDGNTLVLATSGQTGGFYDSQLSFYDLTSDSDEPSAVYSLGNSAILKLNWQRDPLYVLCENQLSFFTSDGVLAGSYSYEGRYLKGFSLDGDGFCSLLLGRYRAGTATELVLVDTQGQVVATQALENQVLSLSSAGRYLSVLTADELTIYTGELEIYHTTDDLQGARKVLQRDDGSVNLIAGETARLYLPD